MVFTVGGDPFLSGGEYEFCKRRGNFMGNRTVSEALIGSPRVAVSVFFLFHPCRNVFLVLMPRLGFCQTSGVRNFDFFIFQRC